MGLSIIPKIKTVAISIRIGHTVVLLMLAAVLSAQDYLPHKTGSKFVLRDADGIHHPDLAARFEETALIQRFMMRFTAQKFGNTVLLIS